VVSMVDGKIRALDGKGFAPIKQAAAAAYERALELGIRAATGAVMELRPDGVARRIVGVDEDLCRAGSTRRADVVAQTERWVAEYVATHGRQPTADDRRAMTQQAVFDTRPAKQGPGGPEGYADWSDRQGSALPDTVGRVADAAAVHVAAPVAGMTADGALDWPAAIRAGVADAQQSWATWQLGDLASKVEDHLPTDMAVPTGMTRAAFVHRQVVAVLASDNTFGVVHLGATDPAAVPDELAMADGRSRFRPHLHGDRYATADQLATEARIVAATQATGAPMVAGPELEMLRVELAAAGLGGDQVEAVVGIIASGRRADVLIGPAGTGKSHTVGELAGTWEQAMAGRVLGLATSEIATANLREEVWRR